MGMNPLAGKKIVLGVTGSIAAYKSVEILRRLQEAGAEVSCVLTNEAQKFIAPLTYQALSRQPVFTDAFHLDDMSGKMPHLMLAHERDLILVAPATAHLMAKMALGLADDLLSTTLLATRAPVILAPAMDIGMSDHPALQQHLIALRGRGVEIVGPDVGPLASGTVGAGRLSSWESILEVVCRRLYPKKDLTGQTVLVSAGPTREAIDPVRFVSNRSSGKMGYALARVAFRRGARVLLVSGPTCLPTPFGVESHSVTTAEEMKEALEAHFHHSTIILMAAAVSDHRPEVYCDQKIKKEEGIRQISLVRNQDILTSLSRMKKSGTAHQTSRPLLIGFAAESHNVHLEAERKLKEKDLDMIVANSIIEPGSGFGGETNRVSIMMRDGTHHDYPLLPKIEVAERILDHVADLLASA